MRNGKEWLTWVAVIVSLAAGGISTRAQAGFDVLHSFTNSTTDGSTPEGQPVLIGSTLYGVAKYGGSNSWGAVYQVSTNGTGFGLVYSFLGGTNGANPYCTLASAGASLYGMTFGGGVDDGGVVFGVNTNGIGYSVLHTFLGGAGDGQYPLGSLTINGTNLYGMTTNGGTNDYGVIFQVNTSGTNFSVIHSFAGGTNDGAFPNEGVVVSGSTLYGTTFNGGSNELGVVFAMNTAASSNGYAILHRFTGGTNDGANPTGPLTLSGSTLYGVTTYGGANDAGVIFEINTGGTGFAVLHSFAGGANDGAYPQFGPLVVNNSVMYGVTEEGGSNSAGVVFQMNTDGMGFTLLHSFSAGADDGGYPEFGPVLSGSMLYGVTPDGGSNDLGVVYGVPTTNTAAPTEGSICTNVPANVEAGTAVMTVIGGEVYTFTATGTACYDAAPTYCVGPNGGFAFTTNGQNFVCMGLAPESLVGEVNGECIQLGTAGTFIAPSSGTLYLLMNDTVGGFFNNSGEWNACITPGDFAITAIAAVTNSVVITWDTFGGFTNYVQVTPGDGMGNYVATNFTDLSGPIIVPGLGAVTTNYTDVGGATNIPSRYYRVRLVL
ncbi:MAG: choice-of-anchor tandem repeat GloVer-containing protein [Verrucomicrobiia bacterium]|jgi:uncharacterized repeat protein (TIGR03803 family)